MVARGRSTAPRTDCLTREVLRIRQPARTRTALIELEMQPQRGCTAPSPASNLEKCHNRSVVPPDRPANTHAAAPR
jgi:hypothetical protein